MEEGPGTVMSLGNINDYLSPSQVCIRPPPGRKQDGNLGETKIEIGEGTGVYYEIDQGGNSSKLEAVTISIDDCLACSGCVTSTETALVASQTYKQVLDVLKMIEESNQDLKGEKTANDKRFCATVVTLSPQTVASFSAKYSIDPQETFIRIERFLKSIGVTEVFDSSFGRDFSLLECAKDFVERYKKMKKASAGEKYLPLFTSSCPGWICYAEKVHSGLLPLITTSKSPQQVLGSFVKGFLPKIYSVPRGSLYHFSIMPCYDKKLESSRSDFRVGDVRDVDCVITSVELELMMREKNFDIRDPDTLRFCRNGSSPTVASSSFSMSGLPHTRRSFLSTEGSSSGGYQSFVMRYAAKELFNIELSPESIEEGTLNVTTSEVTSSNCREYVLKDSESGEALLRFYRVYGFRAMQGVIRAIKKLTSSSYNRRNVKLMPISNNISRKSRNPPFSQDFHFVEIMACPSGCIDGAGQLKLDGQNDVSTMDRQRSLNADAEIAYQSIGKKHGYLFPEKCDSLLELYNIWLNASDKDKSRVEEVLHTKYHAIEKINSFGMKW